MCCGKPIVSIPGKSGLFYYVLNGTAVVYFLISLLKEPHPNLILPIIVWVLYLLPLLWLLIDPYGLSELMMPKINLDMK
jgi:hypothetical protein